MEPIDAAEEHHASLLAPRPIERGGKRRPLAAAALTLAVGYCILLAITLVVGFALVHVFRGSIGQWDVSVSRALARHRTSGWNRVTGDSTWSVNTAPAIGLAAVITAVLAIRRRWREALMLVIALSLELAVFLPVTYTIARPRPRVLRMNATPSTSSFPSGHTAAATVLFAGLTIIVLCCSNRRWLQLLSAVAAALAATTVGFGRVYRGMHYPSDVIVGALMGGACLLISILAIRAWARRTDTSMSATGTAVEAPADIRQPAA